jgi:Flp pilus assembly protein TadG
MVVDFKHSQGSLKKDTRAAVMPLIALSIGLLIMFVGVAVESGRYFLVRNKLNAALDAGLIAAADIATKRLYDDDPAAIVTRAREFFDANFPPDYLGVNVSSSNFDVDFDPDTGTVTGTVNATLPLLFGDVTALGGASLGPDIDMEVFSDVTRTVNSSVEISFAVDNSASMCYVLGTGKAWGVAPSMDPSCAKFNSVKASIATLVNTVQDAIASTANPNNKAYYAYIPYTHDVSINNSKSNFNFIFPSNVSLVESALGLSDNPAPLLSKVAGTSLPTEGGTNTAIGLWWGWASLRDANTSLFTGTSQHQDPVNHPASLSKVANFETTKYMIVLTDGENEYPNRSRVAPYDILSGDANGMQADQIADPEIEGLCDRIKAEEINLCTITFNVPATSPIVTRLAACASPQCSFNATTTADLEIAFENITNRLIDKRITK